MCFSLAYLAQLLIIAIVVCAVVAIFRLVLSPFLATMGPPGSTILGAINIIIWAVVCVAVVVVVFDLLACLLGGGGLHLIR